MKGDLGQTPGGFPKNIQQLILKNEKPYTDRPNAHLKPIDFDKAWEDFTKKFGKHYTFTDLLSWLFYPKVFEEYHQHQQQFGDVYYLPTPVFFYGLKPNEETLVELAPGKSILVSGPACGCIGQKRQNLQHFHSFDEVLELGRALA